ncbi:MAG: NnrU family protein [Hyphomonadaceae bacterium]
MNGFVLALAGFALIHVGVSATGLRAALVGRIGEGPYRGLFSLASLALLAAMIYFYGEVRADPFDPLNAPMWASPAWLAWPARVLALAGVTLAVAGLLTPGPTFIGFEKKALATPEPAHGVLRLTRNPFLWGISLWAAGHLLANGERVAVMLFGVLGLMVILGSRSIDRKAQARDPEGWARFEAVSSNIPFAAIVQGRNRLAVGEMWWRLLVGLAAAFAIAWAHAAAFGAPALT